MTRASKLVVLLATLGALSARAGDGPQVVADLPVVTIVAKKVSTHAYLAQPDAVVRVTSNGAAKLTVTVYAVAGGAAKAQVGVSKDGKAGKPIVVKAKAAAGATVEGEGSPAISAPQKQVVTLTAGDHSVELKVAAGAAALIALDYASSQPMGLVAPGGKPGAEPAGEAAEAKGEAKPGEEGGEHAEHAHEGSEAPGAEAAPAQAGEAADAANAPQSIHAAHMGGAYVQSNPVLNLIEVITGLAASLMALQAALAFRSGRLGPGMKWVTLGMVIMAVGHIILVLRRYLGFDLLGFLGETGSFIGFSLAVFASFITSGLGFWLIRHQADHYTHIDSMSKARTTGGGLKTGGGTTSSPSNPTPDPLAPGGTAPPPDPALADPDLEGATADLPKV